MSSILAVLVTVGRFDNLKFSIEAHVYSDCTDIIAISVFRVNVRHHKCISGRIINVTFVYMYEHQIIVYDDVLQIFN